MTPFGLSVQSVAPSATVWPWFKAGVLRSQILRVMGVLVRWDLHQSKARPRLPTASQYKVLLYLPPFGPNVKLWPQFRPPFGGWGQVGCRGRKWYYLNVVVTFLFDFYRRPIFHRLAIIHNAADRQTDIAMAIGRLNYSIGGLKLHKRLSNGICELVLQLHFEFLCETPSVSVYIAVSSVRCRSSSIPAWAGRIYQERFDIESQKFTRTSDLSCKNDGHDAAS